MRVGVGELWFCPIRLCNMFMTPTPTPGPHWWSIVHFTVVCLVARPLNRSEAKVDLVMIQT